MIRRIKFNKKVFRELQSLEFASLNWNVCFVPKWKIDISSVGN